MTEFTNSWPLKPVTREQRKWRNIGSQLEREALRDHIEPLIRRTNAKNPHGEGMAVLLKLEEWVAKRAARTAAKVGGLGRK